ncbi:MULTISPECIES: GmrSD restriction endonuclease domain-containing protein [unclassified Isoptericola]|uniref:GmrSD restriction endonuclease domain-containing protein n=1 Tax=unclassified Isoptericola TaxID=2623355 RepID=UPI00364EF783
MRRGGVAALGASVALLLGACAGGLDPASTGLDGPGVDQPGAAQPGAERPGAEEPAATSAPTPDGAATAASGTALAALDTLPVKGRAPKTGYTRDQFGPAWADVDHNGCDTRNDILARDLRRTVTDPGTHDCIVLSGVLADPYTGRTIDFRRGQTTSTAVQIDHVVALSDAWQKGAQQLDGEVRRRLANDPLNLLAADGPTNAGKGDGDAATWLPPSKAFRCQYVARQVAVKQAYALWVTQAEHDAIESVLARCPDEPLPAGSLAPRVDATSDEPASDDAASEDTASEDTASGPFANCTEARAAGAAPVHRGDPGYSSRIDRDGDGVACE